MGRAVTPATIDKMIEKKSDNGLGHIISSLTDGLGAKLKYTINGTMMRIDLPAALKPGQKFTFKLNWSYKITDRMTVAGRGGFEYFPEDGNYLFTMAQWYPRLCVYSDFQGWQNHQFTGRGEFALVFGNEVNGVNQQVIDASNYVIEIPQFGTKHSLNVSVCAGIVMWEFCKRYI